MRVFLFLHIITPGIQTSPNTGQTLGGGTQGMNPA